MDDMAYRDIGYVIPATVGDAVETPLILRQIVTTASDDSTDNNLDNLPVGRADLPSPPADAEMLTVDSVVRRNDRFRSIRLLCNLREGWQVPRGRAFFEIRTGLRRYVSEGEDGVRTEILARRYLTTHPDGTTDNNLSSLPEC
jgi:hypothetical protein